MSWRTAVVLASAFWTLASSAQTPGKPVNVAPPWPGVHPDTTRALREFMKNRAMSQAAVPAVCSIPLIAVPLARNTGRIPAMHMPPAGEPIDRMPAVRLPAPPCPEEKR